MKNKESFINGALWLSVSAIILKIIGLIYKIPISYLLGDEGMGIFNSAYTVYTFFYIIGSAGIPKAISIITSKMEAESTGSSIVIYRTAFLVIGISGFVLMGIFLILSGPFSTFIGNNTSFFAMLSIAPTVLFVTLSGVLRGYFSGKMKFSYVAISELISGISKLLLGLLFAFFGIKSNFELPIVCAISILGITFGSFFGFIYLYISNKRIINMAEYKKAKFKLRYMKDILSLAAPITFSAALGSIVNIFDLSIMIKGLINSGYSKTLATALYGNYTTLTVPMLGMVTSIINPISMSIQPILTKNYLAKDKAALELNINSCMELISFISMPCTVLFMFLSREILSIIFEFESAVLAAPMLSSIAPSLLFLGLLTVINTAFESDGIVSVPMISLGAGAVAKLFVSGYLTYNSTLGILSAPIGTLISYFISFIISFAAYIRMKKVRIPAIKYTLKYLIISFVSILPLIICRLFLSFDFSIRMQGIAYLMVFGVVYFSFSLIFSKNIRKNASFFVTMHKKI